MTKKEEKENKKILRTIFVILILFIALVFIYARYVGTSGLVIKEYVIESPRLASNFHGLKIVHFSDLHFGTTVFLEELENVIANINELKPDLIIFTGDLIDSSYEPDKEELEKIINLLNRLDANIDIFAVRGNDDDTNIYKEIIESTDITLLENENELFYYKDDTPILLVGIDLKSDYNKAFEEIEELDYYTIVIAHHPDRFNQIRNRNIDLFLAGHSHNGQVKLPFLGAIVKAAGARNYYDDEYHIGDTRMFISSGIGTTIMPIRLFNRPSINLYRFFAE